MKTPPRWPQPTPQDMLDRYYQQSAVDGILHIRTLDDEPLLTAARDPHSTAHRAILDHLGTATNPDWITARCADEAMDRDLIDEQEHAWITR